MPSLPAGPLAAIASVCGSGPQCFVHAYVSQNNKLQDFNRIQFRRNEYALYSRSGLFCQTFSRKPASVFDSESSVWFGRHKKGDFSINCALYGICFRSWALGLMECTIPEKVKLFVFNWSGV